MQQLLNLNNSVWRYDLTMLRIVDFIRVYNLFEKDYSCDLKNLFPPPPPTKNIPKNFPPNFWRRENIARREFRCLYYYSKVIYRVDFFFLIRVFLILNTVLRKGEGEEYELIQINFGKDHHQGSINYKWRYMKLTEKWKLLFDSSTEYEGDVY